MRHGLDFKNCTNTQRTARGISSSTSNTIWEWITMVLVLVKGLGALEIGKTSPLARKMTTSCSPSDNASKRSTWMTTILLRIITEGCLPPLIRIMIYFRGEIVQKIGLVVVVVVGGSGVVSMFVWTALRRILVITRGKIWKGYLIHSCGSNAFEPENAWNSLQCYLRIYKVEYAPPDVTLIGHLFLLTNIARTDGRNIRHDNNHDVFRIFLLPILQNYRVHINVNFFVNYWLK